MITHSNEVKCTLCNNVDEHKMVTQYRSCQCGYSGCNFGYKCNRCIHSNRWSVHSGGSHSEANEDDSINVRIKGRKPQKRYGIAENVKEILTEWLNKDDMLTAKKALIRLTNRRKEQNSIHKQNEKLVKKGLKPLEVKMKYVFSKNILPTLKQVFIFINYFYLSICVYIQSIN
jgi:hypothetical protein